MAPLWPAGYAFNTSAQEILDPEGKVVAAIDDRVFFGGGQTPHRTPEWCDVAEWVWSISSIEKRD